MNDSNINTFINKNVLEINEIASSFINTSLNLRENIIRENRPEICIIELIRDTYMCNLFLRYIGMMSIIDPNPKWITIDNKMTEYMYNYYNNEKFKNKLVELYKFYYKIYEKDSTNYDYCCFIDKMINKSEISLECLEIKKTIKMLENRIFNIININPILKVATKYFKNIPEHFEIKNDNAIINLTNTNYLLLIDIIDDMKIRHQIEKHYLSRTKNVLSDFSKLIVFRKLLAERSGYSTYFKYINKGKNDNSETIKDFITDLNNKINKKTHIEFNKIYQYFSSLHGIKTKLDSSDIIKYVRMQKNNNKFECNHVLNVIFNLISKYFNIKFNRINEHGWNKNVIIYNVIDISTQKLLGKLFLDITFSENKKIIDPISLRLGDKMQITASNITKSEIVLLGNYQSGKTMTYSDVVLLFREFGYVVINMCYESRAGMINYDNEFSNFIPSLMEYIAWDRETIKMIIGKLDPSIIDHIEICRDLDICYNIKIKCINAKFDHLIHNSEPLLKIISVAIENKNDGSCEILETYKKIFAEMMNPVNDIFSDEINNIDPLLIIQEINNTQAFLYSNLMNEIFSYSTFFVLKNNNCIDDFRKNVLNNGVNNYRDLIRVFLKKFNINCFSLYINNVVKTTVIDDSITEDTNYFEEEYYNESEQDKEEIF